MPELQVPGHTIRQIALVDMKPGPNIRTQVDPDEIADLGESLRKGQHQPVIVGSDLVILDGWRRWLAAQKAGLKSLWAVITNKPLSETERTTAQLVMSIHRKDVSDQDKVKACEQLLASDPSLDQKGLAEKLNVKPGTVSRWLRVSGSGVIPEVRAAFNEGQIGFAAAYPISQAPPDCQAELLQMAREGATREQLANEARRRKQSRPAVRVDRVRCMLASGCRILLSGPSLSLEDVVDYLAEAHREAKKGRDQNLDVKTWERVMTDKAAPNGVAAK